LNFILGDNADVKKFLPSTQENVKFPPKKLPTTIDFRGIQNM
jgi:hypothetical protein